MRFIPKFSHGLPCSLKHNVREVCSTKSMTVGNCELYFKTLGASFCQKAKSVGLYSPVSPTMLKRGYSSVIDFAHVAIASRSLNGYVSTRIPSKLAYSIHQMEF